MMENVKNREGFSLVEVIVAMVILTFGMLAMAASTGYISGQMRSAAFDTKRNIARQQVIEQLRGTFFASIATNSTGLSVGPYTVTWSVTSSTAATKDLNIITSGPAYGRSSSKATMATAVDTARVVITSPK